MGKPKKPQTPCMWFEHLTEVCEAKDYRELQAYAESLEAKIAEMDSHVDPQYRENGLGLHPCSCDRFEQGIRSHHRLCASLIDKGANRGKA